MGIKRVLAIVMVAIMLVGCGVDEKVTSKAPDQKEETKVEKEMMEENIVSQEEDKGTEEEGSITDTVQTETVKSEEVQKTETKKTQTKTPTVTTPVVNAPAVATPEPEVKAETCEHWYQPVFENYTLKKTMVWACNGCGYPLYTIENGKPVNFSNMHVHPPYETDRFDEPCCGGGFHSEIWISGEGGETAKCAKCWGDIVIRDCMFSVMGLRCIHNETLGHYEKIDEENARGYIKSCDCGENLIMVGSDGGVIILEETCVYCGDTKTYPQE